MLFLCVFFPQTNIFISARRKMMQKKIEICRWHISICDTRKYITCEKIVRVLTCKFQQWDRFSQVFQKGMLTIIVLNQKRIANYHCHYIMVFINKEISNTCFRLWRIITTSLNIIPAALSSFERSYLYIFYSILMGTKKNRNASIGK